MIGSAYLCHVELRKQPPLYEATLFYARNTACRHANLIHYGIFPDISTASDNIVQPLHSTYPKNSSSSLSSVQPIPANLNQLGRQSSLCSHFSPSVRRPVTQPLHFGELGQLKKGMCWYPISRNLDEISMTNPSFWNGVPTNGSCSCPQIDQALCCVQVHLPISRRRNHQHDLNG